MNRNGMRHVLIRNKRHPPIQVVFLLKRRVPVSLQMLPMQGQMVERRRKSGNAKVKIPCLLEKIFTWMQWRICGLRRKRLKS